MSNEPVPVAPRERMKSGRSRVQKSSKISAEEKETERARVAALFAATFNTPVGQQTLQLINQKAQYGKSVWNRDASVNNFNQGMQSLAIWINEQMEEDKC